MRLLIVSRPHGKPIPADDTGAIALNIVILSPHRDDAAFALALSMRAWLAAGHRVTVLGVFTRSLSAPFSDADTVHPNDLLGYVSAMRRREDAELLKLMPGLQMIDLNLKDAPSRLRCGTDEVYAIATSVEDTAIPKIQRALTRLESDGALDALLIPLALGGHVDHRVVRNAALSFAMGRPTAFYEDLADDPDASEDDIQKLLEDLQSVVSGSGPLAPVFTPAISDDSIVSISSKRRIVAVYGSQIDDAAADAISGFAGRYGGRERIWADSAWLAESKLA
jgi:LmbE family N-acetylglucosaminyl deacetylase